MAAPKYLRNNAGTLTETAASEASAAEVIPATDATGRLDISFMPVGIAAATQVVVASEALSAGDLVNIWNNAGAFNARKADASVTGKEAHGFVTAAVANGGNATVFFDDADTQVGAGFTPGFVYLSDTTPGKATNVVPSTAGHVVQKVGVAIAATQFMFELQQPIVLA